MNTTMRLAMLVLAAIGCGEVDVAAPGEGGSGGGTAIAGAGGGQAGTTGAAGTTGGAGTVGTIGSAGTTAAGGRGGSTGQGGAPAYVACDSSWVPPMSKVCGTSKDGLICMTASARPPGGFPCRSGDALIVESCAVCSSYPSCEATGWGPGQSLPCSGIKDGLICSQCALPGPPTGTSLPCISTTAPQQGEVLCVVACGDCK